MTAPGDIQGSIASPDLSNHEMIEEKHDTSTHHTGTSTMSSSSSSSSGTPEHKYLQMQLPLPQQVPSESGEPKDTRSILRALRPEFLPDCKIVISRTQYYSKTHCSSPHLSSLWKTTFAGDDEYQPDERLKVLRRYIAARMEREEQLESYPAPVPGVSSTGDLAMAAGTGQTLLVGSNATTENPGAGQDEWRALRERGLAEMNAASSSAIADDDDDDDESTSSDETFDEERDHLSTAFRRLGVQPSTCTEETGSGPLSTVEENAEEEKKETESEQQSAALNWNEFPRRPKEKYVRYAQEKGELQKARETNSQPLPEGFDVVAAQVPAPAQRPALTPEQAPSPSPAVPQEPRSSYSAKDTTEEDLNQSHNLEDKQSPTSSPVSVPPRLNVSAPASSFLNHIRGNLTSGIRVPKQTTSLPCPRRRTTPSTAAAQAFCRQSLRRHNLLSPPPESAVSAGITGGVVTSTEANGELSRTPGPTLQRLFPTGAEWHNVEYYLPPGPRRRGTPSISLLTEEGEVVWAEDRILSIGEARLTLGGGGGSSGEDDGDEEEASRTTGGSGSGGKSVKWGDVTVHRLSA